MIRTLQPTDLSGLLFLTTRSLPNQARPRERLGERPERARVARDLVSHWVPFGKRNHTFLYIQGRHIGGLLSCRSRPDLNTWEVDRLLLLSMSQRHPVVDWGRAAKNLDSAFPELVLIGLVMRERWHRIKID